jgi:hypothetical protein
VLDIDDDIFASSFANISRSATKAEALPLALTGTLPAISSIHLIMRGQVLMAAQQAVQTDRLKIYLLAGCSYNTNRFIMMNSR